MLNLKGVIPIIPATFTNNGAEIDYEDLGRVIDVVINEGVNGIALFGVGTEFYKLSDDERKKMLEVSIERCSKRVPLIASISRHSTELAVIDAKRAQAAGADAIMVFPPYFMSPSGSAIINHICSIASNIDIPIIIQYTPQVTGVTISLETFLEVGRKRNSTIYIKAESVPPGPLISTLIGESDGKMGVFIGNAGLQIFDSLERGACGFMPGCATASVYVKIYNEYVSGSKEKAFELFNKFVPFVNFTGQAAEMFVKLEKMILVQRGIIKSDYCRQPSYTPDLHCKKMLFKYYDYLKEHFDLRE